MAAGTIASLTSSLGGGRGGPASMAGSSFPVEGVVLGLWLCVLALE